MEGFITHKHILVLWGESEALQRANINHKNVSVNMSDFYNTAHLPQNNMIRIYQTAHLQFMIVLNIPLSLLFLSSRVLQAGENSVSQIT